MNYPRADLSDLNAKLTDDEKVRIINAVGQRDITAIFVAFVMGVCVTALFLMLLLNGPQTWTRTGVAVDCWDGTLK